jgi:hypothetical protein
MNRYCTNLFVALLVLSCPSLAAGGDESHIEALLKAPLSTEYVNDGAADATVTKVPIPEVRRLVGLHEKAVHLLIACLDDARSTQAVYLEKNQRYQVPLGYVCLDILMNVIRAPQIIVEDCADDGFGACIAQPYYYKPDVMMSKDPGKIMHAVKSRWEAAYREGKLKFVYPSWWY